MNANSQAQQGYVGCAGGIPNHKNLKDGPPFTGIEFNDGGDDKAGEIDIKLGTANIAVNEVISGERAKGAAEVPPCIDFNDGRDNDTVEEDIKVATGNIAVNEVISGERAEGASEVHPCQPLLPAFGSNRVYNTAAKAVSSEGKRIENMRMLMLSMQMQQMAQQILMQQEIFLQQMQMQMSEMEKRADTSEKYLRRIAKAMTTHNDKHKRGRTDEKDDDSSNDDK
jgi:hypothetical protein